MHHQQHDWLDQAPDEPRVVFDTGLTDKFGGAAGYANNWIRYNRDADVRKELTANVIGNAVIVPAGILAVTRAQERGYAMVSIG